MVITESKELVFNEIFYNYFNNSHYHNRNIFTSLKTLNTITDISRVDIKIAFQLLCNNRNQSSKILDLVNRKIKNQLSWFDYIEYIINSLAIPYLNISDVAKAQYAEVFTPIWVVDKMLDKYPEEDFSNPNLKWLDPANGIGNFPLRLIQRLLNGLKNVPGLEDENIRYKHIVENMIYVCEIQPINMFAFMMFIDPNCEFKLNSFRGSYIENEFDFINNNEWKLDLNTRIIGNPPFQSKDNKANKLWIKFASKCVKISNYVNFIVPISFMRSNSIATSKLRKSLHDKENYFDLRFQDIFDVAEKVIIFTTFGTTKTTLNSKIILNNKVLEISNSNIGDRLPIDDGQNSILSILSKIEKRGKLNKMDFVWDFYYNTNQTTPDRLIKKGLASKSQDDDFPYPVHHSASQMLYSSSPLNTWGKLKVLFNYSGGFVGKKYMFATTNLIGKQMVGVLVNSKEESEIIIHNYSHKVFEFYIMNEKTGGFNTGLFKLPKLPLQKLTDKDLYNYFEFTPEEIKLIEDFKN